jgi:Ser/Thr protein kinase RdoA (MazF antagonist)
MEKRIKDRYGDDIYQQALARYDIKPDRVTPLDGFESFIYEFARHEREYILRISHSLRRNPGLIAGEVDWINYLADRGVPAARAISSAQKNLIEAIDDDHDGFFLATAFEKAPGNHIKPEAWNGDFFERYGHLLGRMHALSQQYRPPKPAWKRPEWDDPEMLDLKPWIPASEPLVTERWLELEAYLATLPKDAAGYGLIHQDAHAGNFFVDEDGQMTLFDFDDSIHGWYGYDIAIVLFYAIMGEPDWPAFTRSFMSRFLKGYARENRLPPAWLREIPHFLKLREIDLYAVIHRSFDVQNLDHPWLIRYMDGRRERIEAGQPYIDFDFTSLESYLAE